MTITKRAMTLVLGLFIAACGQAPATGGGTAPTGTATATSTATAAAASPTGSPGIRADACALARADVEPVIGTVTAQQARTDTVPGTTAPMNVTACVFTSADGAMTFAVTRAPVTRADFEAAVRQVPGVRAEAGVGDSAFSGTVSATGAGLGSATTLFVLKGSTYFTIQAASRTRDGAALLIAARALAQKVAGTL